MLIASSTSALEFPSFKDIFDISKVGQYSDITVGYGIDLGHDSGVAVEAVSTSISDNMSIGFVSAQAADRVYTGGLTLSLGGDIDLGWAGKYKSIVGDGMAYGTKYHKMVNYFYTGVNRTFYDKVTIGMEVANMSDSPSMDVFATVTYHF